MAYSFDELFTYQIPQGQLAQCATTFVITQEDGRTAFAQHPLQIDVKSHTLSAGGSADPAFNPSFFFSDRGRFGGGSDTFRISIKAASPPPKPGQPVRPPPRGIDATFTLDAWGGTQYTVTLNLQPNFLQVGKLYEGRGQTIGHGTGLALHTLAFGQITTYVPQIP